MHTIRLKLPNVDRVGLVLDISHTLVSRQINIVSMEVEPNVTYLELAAMPETVCREVISALLSIPQILDVVPIKIIPHQVRTEQLKDVMSGVGDGIVAMDAAGIVTQYNPAAENHSAFAEGTNRRSPSDCLPAGRYAAAGYFADRFCL